MTEVNRKIHVIGINSFKFEDLSFKSQNLFLETTNIAVPSPYLKEIKSWSKNSLLKKKQYTPIIIKGTNFANVGLLSKAKNFIRYILNKNYNPHLLSIAKKN